jgi:hypothetical protein
MRYALTKLDATVAWPYSNGPTAKQAAAFLYDAALHMSRPPPGM